MTGTLTIAGLGPGSEALVTPEVSAALAAATDILGYAPYVARVPPRTGLTLHPSDNREELQRASEALRLAAEGAAGRRRLLRRPRRVRDGVGRVRGAGDRRRNGATSPFAFCPVSQRCWRRPRAPVRRSAMISARSISRDNLKPWAVVEKRLRLAAEADFAIALYNPRSASRPEGFARALEMLKDAGCGERLMIFARAVTTPRKGSRP